HIVTAGSGLFDQLDVTDVTAHTFLEVDLLAFDRAGWTGVFTNGTDLTLRNALDTERADDGHDAQRSSKRTHVAAVKTRHHYTGQQDGCQDGKQHYRATHEKQRAEGFKVLEYLHIVETNRHDDDKCQYAVFDIQSFFMHFLRDFYQPAFGCKTGDKVLHGTKRAQ